MENLNISLTEKKNYIFTIKDKLIVITNREFECLYYVSKFYTVKEIGKQLKISNRTVEKHLKSICLKCNSQKTKDLLKILNIVNFNYLDTFLLRDTIYSSNIESLEEIRVSQPL